MVSIENLLTGILLNLAKKNIREKNKKDKRWK